MIVFWLICLSLLATMSISCTAQPATEKEALDYIRRITAKGELPPEAVVANLETRFSGKRAGTLARLLRARVRMEKANPLGAAALLESSDFARLTKLGDYALWLRGKALLDAERDAEARRVLETLSERYPSSLRVRDSILLRADSLIRSDEPEQVPELLRELSRNNDPDALLMTARAYEASGEPKIAVRFYRRAYFFAAGTEAASSAETRLEELGEDLTVRSSAEIAARASDLLKKGSFSKASEEFKLLLISFPSGIDDSLRLKIVTAFSGAGLMPEAKSAFNSLTYSSAEKPRAFYRLALGYARARRWTDAKSLVRQMRNRFPKNRWTPKTMIDAGLEARRQRRRKEESELLGSAVIVFPDAIDVAKAQFELAWLQHEAGNFEISSRMLIEHLARYVDKDNTYRGQTGYWAARDSERAGRIGQACALYDGTAFRYGSNWYGYLALDRLTRLRRKGRCRRAVKFPGNSLVPKAVENLKIVTVAAETASDKELRRVRKSSELSLIGLFDWSLDELKESKKTAANSPSVNLALARHYRLKGDNVRALLALKESYPDYPQMFPKEMDREVWEIFYPLFHWDKITYWSRRRRLDPYQVAGVIRQETIFEADARSRANAYGLMQLLIPTARKMALKYGAGTTEITAAALYTPALNIELGTAYMREQLSKYGRIEYMSVAYNAGPSRVVRWQKTLPKEIDDFVENIPFRETKGYVKGVIRNSAQYRRLYDLNGKFKKNVGSRPLRKIIDSSSPSAFAKEFPFVKVARNAGTSE